LYLLWRSVDNATMVNDKSIRVWGIHATGEPDLLIERNCIALGGRFKENLENMPRERNAFKSEYVRQCKERHETPRSIAQTVGQLLRFVWEAKKEDYVVYPMPKQDVIWIGRITGNYRYEPSAVSYKQQRDVKWLGHWKRHDFTPGAQSALCAHSTFWQVKKFAEEFLACAKIDVSRTVIPHEQRVYENVYAQLDGHQFAMFVADLFREHGYTVEVRPRSGDHGVDLVATKKDALLKDVAKIQVKRYKRGAPEDVVQQLRGALCEGEVGVIVAYGGLQSAAQIFAKEHAIQVIDGKRIQDLAMQHESALSKRWPQVFNE